MPTPHQLAAPVTRHSLPALFVLSRTKDGHDRIATIHGLPRIDPEQPEQPLHDLTQLCITYPHLVRGIFSAASHALPNDVHGVGLRLSTAESITLYTCNTQGEHHTHQRTQHALITFTPTYTETTREDGTHHIVHTKSRHHSHPDHHPRLYALARALTTIRPIPDATSVF